MKESLYERIVYLMRTYGTWLDVISYTDVQKYAVIRNGRLTDILCRMLVLQDSSLYGRCRSRQRWNIAECDLDEALSRLCNDTPDFRKRIKESVSNMSSTDVNNIILLATRQALNPNLRDNNIYSSSSL
jgi:hypothetical protein